MGGDCAEAFNEFSVNHIRDTFRVILQMSLVMSFGGSMPIIKIGRMAGQFAKPRSDPDEVIDGVALPSYRGDIINGDAFTLESRTHNPERMMGAYYQSAQTLNILRAFSTGGYADMSRLHAWNLDFVQGLPAGSRYKEMCAKVDESLRFMKAIGVDTRSPTFTQCNFYTAHECLLLPYEQALTRQDSITDRWYGCSAHMLWIGERTRQLDHAHVHFCAGVNNPIGIKVSEKCTPEELLTMLDTINPDNIPGRVTIVVRMGAQKVREHLPKLIRAVQREGRTVLWISDPVHGNTIKTDTGVKTRPFERIRDELRAFFDVHAEMGTHPGGVHLEMTGEDVTECTGGSITNVSESDLEKRYNTYCDPRLNGDQALELAFLIAERMRKAQGLDPLFANCPV
jgi:3-deoxy-7-phosphoheptulonate synthase